MKKLLPLLLFPLMASAQTTRTITIDPNTDSMWAVPTWVNTTMTLNAALTNASGVKIVSAPVTQVAFAQSPITVTFPAASADTAVKLDLSGTQTGAKFSGTWTLSYPFPAPLPLAAGEIVTLTAIQGFLSGSLTATIVTPAPPVVIAPPPVVVAPPVVVPPPVIVPPPTGTSPDGTKIPPATSITDATGATWKFSGTHPQRNGAETGGSGGVLMTIKAGVVYFEQSPLTTGQWWKWNGSGWASSAAP